MRSAPCLSRVVCMLFLTSLALPASGADDGGAIDALTLETLRKEIKRQEDAVANLEAHGEAKWMARPNPEAPFKETGKNRINGLYHNALDGPAKLDFEESISPWHVHGDVRVAEEKFIVAFDGRIGQQLTLGRATTGGMKEVLSGTIRAQRSNDIKGGSFATGWSVSIYGASAFYRQTFSGMLSEESRYLRKLNVRTTQLDGKEVAEITYIKPVGVTSWYFDPANGYRLFRNEIRGEGDRLIRQMNVTRFHEIAPGVFYPASAVSETYATDNQGRLYVKKRATMEVDRAVIREKVLPRSAFQIQWPGGTVIHDEITNTRFRVGVDPEEELGVVLEQAE